MNIQERRKLVQEIGQKIKKISEKFVRISSMAKSLGAPLALNL